MMRPPEPSDIEKEEVKSQSNTKNSSLLDYDDLESVDDYEEKTIYVRTKKVGYLIGTSEGRFEASRQTREPRLIFSSLILVQMKHQYFFLVHLKVYVTY